MNDGFRDLLKRLIAQHGRAVCFNQQKLVGLLLDECMGQNAQEVSVITQAVRTRVAEEIDSQAAPELDAFAIRRLVTRLEVDPGMAPDVAEWAVVSWAVALGKRLPAQGRTHQSDIDQRIEAHLRAHRSNWNQPEVWGEFVETIPKAVRISVKERDLVFRADELFPMVTSQIKREEELRRLDKKMKGEAARLKAERAAADAERTRAWVGALAANRWDVVSWSRFLNSLGPDTDEVALARLRDKLIQERSDIEKIVALVRQKLAALEPEIDRFPPWAAHPAIVGWRAIVEHNASPGWDNARFSAEARNLDELCRRVARWRQEADWASTLATTYPVMARHPILETWARVFDPLMDASKSTVDVVRYLEASFDNDAKKLHDDGIALKGLLDSIGKELTGLEPIALRFSAVGSHSVVAKWKLLLASARDDTSRPSDVLSYDQKSLVSERTKQVEPVVRLCTSAKRAVETVWQDHVQSSPSSWRPVWEYPAVGRCKELIEGDVWTEQDVSMAPEWAKEIEAVVRQCASAQKAIEEVWHDLVCSSPAVWLPVWEHPAVGRCRALIEGDAWTEQDVSMASEWAKTLSGAVHGCCDASKALNRVWREDVANAPSAWAPLWEHPDTVRCKELINGASWTAHDVEETVGRVERLGGLVSAFRKTTERIEQIWNACVADVFDRSDVARSHPRLARWNELRSGGTWTTFDLEPAVSADEDAKEYKEISDFIRSLPTARRLGIRRVTVTKEVAEPFETEEYIDVDEPYEVDVPYIEEVLVRPAGLFRSAVYESIVKTRILTRTRKVRQARKIMATHLVKRTFDEETRVVLDGFGNEISRYDFVRVAPGRYTRGETYANGKSIPVHEVVVTRAFEMMAQPVRISLWKALMDENRGLATDDDGPIRHVSWFDAVEFCNRLSEEYRVEPAYTIEYKQDGRVGIRDFASVTWKGLGHPGFRLPTEAEWELAWSGISKCSHVKAESGGYFHGLLHGFGRGMRYIGGEVVISAMGGMWQWVWDLDGSHPNAGVDPIGPEVGEVRVLRVGDKNSHRKYVSGRHTSKPIERSYCFRVVRSVI